MFQSFDSKSSPEIHPPRLAAAPRTGGARSGRFHGAARDAHQGEYVYARDARLAWLTGFTGSAGFCIVTPIRPGVLSMAATACR